MKTQLCLVSGELMPNVIGALHEQPDAVIPVVTKESAYQVEHLEKALRAAECRANLQDPVTVLPYDLADCVQTIGDLAKLERELTINWTGGTKIMSYAARAVAEAAPAGVRAIYVNTAGCNLLVEEDPKSRSPSPEMLDSAKLGLNNLVHILASGHTVRDCTTLAEFRQTHTPPQELVAAAEAILDARSRERDDLFKLAGAADVPHRPRNLTPQFIEILESAKLIQRSNQPGAFFLGTECLARPFHRNSPQDENGKFIKGGYLEVFFWSQLKSRGAFDDVAWHVTLNEGQQGRVTELDVAVASDGRFLIVESKGRVELHKGGQNEKDQKSLADLIEEQFARTRRIGRLFGHWILYVHQFRAEYEGKGAQDIIASQEARARDYGGRLLWRDDLVDFPVLVAAYLNELKPNL